MKFKVLVALLACALLGAGCGGDGSIFAAGATTTTAGGRDDPDPNDDRDPNNAGDADGADDDTAGNVELDVELDEPIRPLPTRSERDRVANDADTVMIAAAIDLQEFWDEAYPAVYGDEMVPLDGGFWSYGPSTPESQLPPCGESMGYDQMAQNAFYCSITDLIAWDAEGLIEPFIDSWGAFTAALVMAHEFGHAVQARSGDFTALEQVYTELQADCFAGAWVRRVADGDSEVFQATLTELDLTVAGLLAIRDVPGSSPDDPRAHGSGFDRVSAFSEGLFQGVERCARYGDAPPVVTQEMFTSEADAATGGNLSADELLPLLYTDLEDFYATTFASTGRSWTPVDDIVLYDPQSDVVSCGDIELSEDEATDALFYCVDANVVLADGRYLYGLGDQIGDFAIGTEIARQWAFAAQVQQGNLDNSLETSLHADCLTGLYAGDVYFELRDTAELQLSPGDLDEALMGFLLSGSPGDEGATGTAFQRTDAFRSGFLADEATCDTILAG